MVDLATKLAAALLLKRGEITLAEIEALPLVDDERAAMRVASHLREMFDTCSRQREMFGADNGGYEEVISLRSHHR